MKQPTALCRAIAAICVVVSALAGSLLAGQTRSSTSSKILKAESRPISAARPDIRLVDALQNQDNESVRLLLKQRIDVNARQADGATALAWATHWDDMETAQLLIRAGADVNAANDYGVTPLSLACTNRNAAMVAKLLKAGANPNAAQWTGETPLLTCARTGDVESIKSLIEYGAKTNAKENKHDQTALMWAVAEKHPGVVRVLIEHGADVNARSKFGFDPLLVSTYGDSVPALSKGGFTPLFFAARDGDLDCARILLAAGAKVNDVTPDGMTPLLVAASSGHETLSIFLLDHGADPNAADANGLTALHYALIKGLSILRGVIFRAEVSPYLTYLLRSDMVQLVKSLVDHGANPNAQLKKEMPRIYISFKPYISLVGATPFLLASASGDVPAMRLLLTGGADPLMATKGKTTPLMVAAGVGRDQDRTEEEERSALEAVQLITQLGGDVNASNESGLVPKEAGITALHGSAYIGSSDIIEFLVANGARMDVKDKCGHTPLNIAEGDPAGLMDERSRHTHKSTAELLRKLGAQPASNPTRPPGTPAQSRTSSWCLDPG